MQNETQNIPRAATARQSGKALVLCIISICLIVYASLNIKSTQRQIEEKRAAMAMLESLQSAMIVIGEILAESEKLGGLFLPVGVIYEEDEHGNEYEVLIAYIVRSESLGWDPDEFVTVLVNKEGQVVIRRIGLEMKSLVKAARRNSEKMEADWFSKCLKKYRNGLGPALKRYLKAHLEASNRRPEIGPAVFHINTNKKGEPVGSPFLFSRFVTLRK